LLTAPLAQLILVLSVLVSGVIEVEATEPKSLLFAVNSPGSFPYLYFDIPSKSYLGLIPDFFADLEQQGILKTVFIDSNQLRSEQFVIEGKVDLYLANRQWLTQPEKVISSIPIVHHFTYLYSLSPFSDDFSAGALVNKQICTQQDYVYTGLQQPFKSKKLLRFDSSSQTTIGSMLANGRCDYAVLNNYNAKIVFSEVEYCHLAIYQSPNPTSEIDLTVVMRPELKEVKIIIDNQIKAFISSGKANTSLLTHSTKPIFPKPVTCIANQHK
jgi:ABC-type amino acid transport substrate-binding protein